MWFNLKIYTNYKEFELTVSYRNIESIREEILEGETIIRLVNEDSTIELITDHIIGYEYELIVEKNDEEELTYPKRWGI